MLTMQGFLETLYSARTGRLLELTVRLFGKHNSARMVHAVINYLHHFTPLAPNTVAAKASLKANCFLTASQRDLRWSNRS